MTARRLLATAGILLLLALGVATFIGIRMAQREAVRLRASGRLSQLHLALANYEYQNGVIPSRFAVGKDGSATHSWVAFILEYAEQTSVSDRLVLSEAWDSNANRAAISACDRFTQWFGAEGIFPCALAGQESIWKTETGEPKGPLAQFPDSIVLLGIPSRSGHPLQPFAIDEAQVRQLLANGEDVLFINAAGETGHARMQHGEIVYELRLPRPQTIDGSRE